MTREEVLDEINVIYERLSHPEDCENGVYSFSDGKYTEALEILIDYYEVGLIEELEKIKEEMVGDIVITLKDETDKVILEHNKTIYSNIGIIDKHISELKGENK